MGTTASVIAALASLTQTGTSIYGMTQAGAAPGIPKPQPPLDTSQMARAQLGRTKADAAARVGGGISPEFLASLLGQEVGVPGAGMDILKDIRGSLNMPGQGP